VAPHVAFTVIDGASRTVVPLLAYETVAVIARVALARSLAEACVTKRVDVVASSFVTTRCSDTVTLVLSGIWNTRDIADTIKHTILTHVAVIVARVDMGAVWLARIIASSTHASGGIALALVVARTGVKTF
jgi:hypothetical protein